MRSGRFTIQCSRSPFSEDELDILERYGMAFERLANRERAPATAAQEQFLDVARGKRPPESVYERVGMASGFSDLTRALRVSPPPSGPTPSRGPEWAYARNSPSISDIRRISMSGSRLENGWKPNFA